jgi:glycosyltransferase involved in cell wall biosynthesis
VSTAPNKDGTLRLLYANSDFRRADNWTGVRARQLVDALTDRGVVVTTFPPSEGLPGQQSTTTKRLGGLKDFVQDNLPTGLTIWLVEIWLVFGGALRSLWNLVRAISARGNLNAEVLLVRPREYDWTPWLLARILGLPVVQEIHSVFYVERAQRWSAPAEGTGGLLSRLERAQWRSAAGVWVNSKELKSIIVDSGIDARKVHFVPFGVAQSPRQFPGERRDVGRVRIAFVGSFYPWHGVQSLIRAFAGMATEVPEATLVLIGDGIIKAQCEAEVEERGLHDRVEFTGWLPRDQMIERLREVDIGVAPYLAVENFYFEPVKIFDYLAAGLAVIASAQGRVRDMLDGGAAGCLVPAGDEAALTRQLILLCRDPALRARLGAEARQRYLDRYTLAATASQVIEICAGVLEQSAVNAGGASSKGK